MVENEHMSTGRGLLQKAGTLTMSKCYSGEQVGTVHKLPGILKMTVHSMKKHNEKIPSTFKVCGPTYSIVNRQKSYMLHVSLTLW